MEENKRHDTADTLAFAKAYIEVKNIGLAMTCHKERKLFQDCLLKSDDRFKIFTTEQLKKGTTGSTLSPLNKEYSCVELGKTVMRKSCGSAMPQEEVRDKLVKNGYLTKEDSTSGTYYFPSERGSKYVVGGSNEWPIFSQAFYDAIETSRISMMTRKNNKAVAALNLDNGIEEVKDGELKASN
ncbi:hypothetical protein KI655_18530 [Vibrio sp. D404a]|uniref:hypothetical protein n=1 Tax=unclassified Vibrio TaxID=2614977 RepID=UPI0025536CB5|nr:MULTISPECIES: hypothetical protein [unclassified Vibrio]MDK9739295.1 hypothetical protein [Vibrio sp. D404a]MDK9797669.1 hypothetical protein [Vibrio sp. D449a]